MLGDRYASVMALRDDLACGVIDAQAVTAAYLEQVAKLEPTVQAWAWIDSDYALHQAKLLDDKRCAGEPLGALHGLPVGVKDIIDTAGVPTCNGTALDAGRVPAEDAIVIQQLKQAGAVILGKTVTTELAFLEPSKTRHPANASRTPGGSSSGSAAAVACGMVPLAVGTQTGGSVIRPAAFCGVTGFKPSFGRVPRTGVLKQSQSLDTLGVFAGSVSGAALLADVMYGYDPSDAASRQLPSPQLLSTVLASTEDASTQKLSTQARPTFAFVRTPFWSQAEATMQKAIDSFTRSLGDCCYEADLPTQFTKAADVRALINQVEMASNFQHYALRDASRLSRLTQDFMAVGGKVLACDYLSAVEYPDMLNAELEDIFDHCDVILSPSAPGPAPGIESTGNAIFNGIWTLCGTPTITLPLLKADDGMPMGVQLIAKRDNDASLLSAAHWLEAFMSDKDN